ncbi:MAG: outer membrane beta-barrel protein, partial [Crocinitomicaceae bacterium]
MKKVILLGIAGVILFSSTAALAQESSDKKINANWGGLDFGFVSTNSSDEWGNKILQSSSFGLNVVEYKLPIFKQYIGLTTGLGFNFRTIAFQNQYAMVSTDSTISLQTGNPTLYDSLASIKYSTFNQGFVQVPLLLDFSTKTRQAKSFSIAAGVIGGLRMYAFHQLRGKYSNGDKFNNQMRNDKFYHSNLFNLDATVRIGYGAIGVFGT